MSDYLEDIDKYLNGDMNNSEKEAFEKNLTTDSELADAFNFEKEIRMIYSEDEWITLNRSVLNSDRAKAMKSYLQSDEITTIKETISNVIADNRKTYSRKSFIKQLAVAASILLISTISYFSIKSNSTDFESIINEEYKNLPSLVNRSESADTKLIEGQQYFENKDYKNATISFTEYQRMSSESNTTNALSYIYNGLSFLAINDFTNAIDQFDLLQNSESLQAKKATWYKAIIYLKQKDYELLKRTLKTITSDASNYNYLEAKELLNEIE
ncbi:hypothetical protein EV195_11611 [Tenacibaculum skagerrakense]|uniref:Tetratricopeptide repeat protein n=1 Tax=Tenacibaculum skagerrakense TaxID=186571 RepID=A0A4R2NKF0_9FLAO|nr:hypothetical protein [Tenacibaculum skagerrakense]TCP21745.1 hypothetical protein EV195_11611 [Tenacibaculum skagerrakense]